MPVTSSNIILRAPTTIDDSDHNGGVITWSQIPSTSKNNIFPDVRSSERLAGSVKRRKVFVHFTPHDNAAAYDVYVVPVAPTPAGDHCLMYKGTASETQAAFLAANRRPYGVCTVNSGAVAGSTSLVLQAESDAPIFEAGDRIVVTDKPSPTSNSGSEEFIQVASATYAAGQWTLTLASPLTLTYALSPVRAGSCMGFGDVQVAVEALTQTSAQGLFNPAAVTVSAGSTLIQERITISFTSSTEFEVMGSVSAVLPPGVVGSVYSAGGSFSIPAGAWSGTWQADDQVAFDVVPATLAFWLERVIPANTPSFSDNRFSFMIDLESA